MATDAEAGHISSGETAHTGSGQYGAGGTSYTPAKPPAKKAPAKPKPKPNRAAPVPNAKPGSGVHADAVPNAHGSLAQFINAIMREESGGNYGAVSKASKTGDHAYGKYQIMGANIPSWSKEILGHAITVQQYLNSPDLQEKIAQGKLTQYYNKYGAAGAASAWFTGSPTTYQTDPNRSDGNKTVAAYVRDVTGAMGSQPATIQSASSTGGGAGTAQTTATGGGTTNQPGWNQRDFQNALSDLGFATGLIKSDSQLQKVFTQAVQGKWDTTRFTAAIKNTKWWQSRTVAQRQFDELIYSDGAQAHRLLAQMQSQIKTSAAQYGVTLSDAALTNITHVAVRNGLSNTEIQQMIGAQSKSMDPSKAHGGTYGQTVDQLKAWALDYNVPLSTAQLQQFASNVVSGTADISQYQDFIKTQASSKYPWLKDKIDQGFTIAQLADTYKNTMAQYLEIDPNTIKLSDPTIQKGLQYLDPTNQKGGYNTMPLWKYQETLKADPRWLKTNNARDSLMDVGVGVLKDFGLVT